MSRMSAVPLLSVAILNTPCFRETALADRRVTRQGLSVETHVGCSEVGLRRYGQKGLPNTKGRGADRAASPRRNRFLPEHLEHRRPRGDGAVAVALVVQHEAHANQPVRSGVRG